MSKFRCLGLVLAFCAPTVLCAQEPKFMRIKEEDGKVTALEIAVTRYANKSKTVTVDLVGVVHIGDRAYYQKLNKRLADYDAVLYELVAAPGAKVPKGGKKEGVSAFMSALMTTFLDLDSQLAQIDYRPKHFIHADLSFEAMMEAASARGDDHVTLGLSLLADLLRKQNLDAKKNQDKAPADPPDFAELLSNPTRLKRDMARQMMGGADLGPTLQVLLVADRNKKACQVLTQQITDAKKKLAIFYGAAHMPDFDRRLREDFGLVRQSQEWLTAWDLRDGKSDPAERLLKSLLEKALQN